MIAAEGASTGIPPSAPRRWFFDRSLAIQWAVLAIAAPVVLAPILPIVYQSFIDRPVYDHGHELTLANYARFFASGEIRSVLAYTFAFAILSTLISQLLGAAFAILLGRTDIPGRRLFGELMLWPMYISGLVLGFGWVMAYGPTGFFTLFWRSGFGAEPWSLYSFVAMSLVAGTAQAPLAFLYCLGSIALADASVEDAARSCGAGPLRVLRSVTLPLLLPAILYSGILNFVAQLETLSIPLIFGEPAGIRLLMPFLYIRGLQQARPDYGLVASAALILILVVIALIYLQSRFLRNAQRFVTVRGKAARPKMLALGWLRWPAAALVVAYLLFCVVFPIGVLFLRAGVRFLSPLVPFWELFSLANFRQLFVDESVRRSITNTLVVAGLGGAVGTFFMLMIAVVVHRSDFPLKKPLAYAALLPRALPGMIVGIGFFYAVVFFPPFGWLRNTILILVLAYIMRNIPMGFGALSPTLLQVSADLDRGARVSGADWWTTVHAIVMRVSKPAIFTCFALLFIAFVKEYSIAVFLVAPGSEVIGSTLLQTWGQGNMGQVAALSCVQIVITVLFVLVARRLVGVKLYG